MKQRHRRQRILILSLLSFSLFAPIVRLSPKLKTLNSIGLYEVREDLASVKYRTDDFKLNAIEQKRAEDLKGPKLIVLNENEFSSVVSRSSDENPDSNQSKVAQDVSKLLATNETNDEGKDGYQIQQKKMPIRSRKQEQFNQEAGRHHRNSQSQSHRVKDKKLKKISYQLSRAKAYLSLASPSTHPELEKELRMRIKEGELAVGKASKDSELPRSASQKIRSMEVLLAKANHAFTDCFEIAETLRAMANDTEEQVQVEKNEESYLIQLAGRTTPKGLHCLSIRLTTEYLLLQPEERQFPNQHKLQDLDFYHYAVFSDEILACAVVVNSTTASAKGLKRPLWKTKSLPLGWITFYNQTVALEKSWHAFGLGHNSGLSQGDIEHAAVIHFDGIMKPWLEIGIAEYKGYWSKHVQYDHPYLQECNIHE
ncbi:hypothetical protein V6Z11_D08G072200 [Gossypium hirsutum]